jgi:leucyl-tRNA synthetase
LKLLSPFCPHITEELWEKFGNKDFISTSFWPAVDEGVLEKNLEKKIDLNEKVSKVIIDLLNKFKDKKVSKIYLYVIPNEIESYDKNVLEKEIGKVVEIFSTNDSKKYDPENKAKKARPAMPGIYFEE